MSLNKHAGNRPVDQRGVQPEVLAAVNQRVLQRVQQQMKGQDRAREQQLKLILRCRMRDQLIGDPLSLGGQSTQADRQDGG